MNCRAKYPDLNMSCNNNYNNKIDIIIDPFLGDYEVVKYRRSFFVGVSKFYQILFSGGVGEDVIKKACDVAMRRIKEEIMNKSY